jgi:predicted esterase
MKEFCKFYRTIILSLTLALFIPFGLLAQRTQTARSSTPIDAFCGGFYESLPPNYSGTSTKYPLLVFLHGQGEIGDGSAGALPSVLVNGPPMQIHAGTFPDPVIVDGQSFNFIVISPQLNQWPAWGDEQTAVNDIITYAINHYRVDITRIYLTGLSMGGGIAWEYASYNDGINDYTLRLAGLLDIAGASFPEPERSAQMAADHLPVWATANQDDPTVPSSYSIDYTNQMIADGANPAPLLTIFPASGHGGWAETYNSLTNSAGQTVYQWMLQFQRVGSAIIVGGGGILPVTLTDYRAEQTGPSSISVNWTTGVEQNDKYFILQRSADGQAFSDLDTIPATNQATGHSYAYTDQAPLAGNNFYRLTQVDLDGKTTIYRVLDVILSKQTGTLLTLSPNPAHSTVYLQLTQQAGQSGQDMVNITLSDAQGKILRSWQSRKQGPEWNQSLDVSRLASGNYFISLQTGDYKVVRQFLKK